MKKYIDFKLLQILALFYTVSSLVSLTKISYLKINDFGYEFTSWKEIFLETIILDWLIVLFVMSTIAITTKIMILRQIKWRYIVSLHAFFSLFIGFILYFLSSIIYLITGQISYSEIDFTSHFAGIISVLDLNFLVYFSMISIVYSYYYFQKIQKSELEKSQLTNQLTNAKLNILKYKLHPHFLFNTLNSISSLIQTDAKLAQDTIADFGDLLRDLLDLKDTSLITLKEELNISKKYLDIMTLRFSDHLTIAVNIEEEIEKVLVPSLILLPIIENCIKHGYSYDNTSLNIQISVTTIKNKIIFNIKNDGATLKTNFKRKGQGLQNTIDRLNILYNSNYKYTFTKQKNNKGVVTTIVIPKKIK